MKLALEAAVALVALSVLGCAEGTRSAAVSGSRLPTLGDVEDAQWARLAQRRVFFGHQSVGQNIMDGVAAVLAANPRISLTVVESKDLRSGAAGFYHAKVGRNTVPASKTEEFAGVVDQAFGAGAGVGLLKFCYVDVQPDTDPAALFAAYQRRMADLTSRHPGLTLVHVTLPLTRSERGWAYLKSRLRGRPTERALDVIRNRYNALLREAYAGRAPVFDLARLESTRGDASRSFVRQGADTVFTMADEYTTDGGHLNEAGQRLVAEQLLIFLARLPPP